jgi:hypothetical protein
MYDPSTVAFEIRYPWWRTSQWGDKKRRYHSPFITIWHKDPEQQGRGNRTDDSCGWFRPPTTKAQRDRIEKLGREEWWSLFRKRDQEAKGDPEGYAYICYEPSTYDAVYWAWRAIKRNEARWYRPIWKYGRKRANYLTRSEMDYIYSLASNPVDNLRVTVAGIKNEDDCADFFLLVHGAYQRHWRPWWRHPRWHVHHWRLQIHPWQHLRRWLFTRCCKCGKRFPYGASVCTDQWDATPHRWWESEKDVYHLDCQSGDKGGMAASCPNPTTSPA